MVVVYRGWSTQQLREMEKAGKRRPTEVKDFPQADTGEAGSGRGQAGNQDHQVKH